MYSEGILSSLAESPECWNLESVQIFADSFLTFADKYHRFATKFISKVEKHINIAGFS